MRYSCYEIGTSELFKWEEIFCVTSGAYYSVAKSSFYEFAGWYDRHQFGKDVAKGRDLKCKLTEATNTRSRELGLIRKALKNSVIGYCSVYERNDSRNLDRSGTRVRVDGDSGWFECDSFTVASRE